MELIKQRYFLCTLLLVMLSCVFVLAGCGDGLVTFSIKGRVVYNDEAIIGATVKTDTGLEVQTDENGCFEFTDFNNAVTLSFSADGYVFETARVVVYKETKDLVIRAERVYTLTGRVVSNDVGVPNALVEVTGLVNRTATTDSYGYFSVNDIAGESTVKVEKDGFVFETKTATIDNANLIFSGTTNITVSIVDSSENIISNASVKVNDVEIEFSNGVYIASNVDLGSMVVPSLESYHFEPASITITQENQQIEFVAYPIYSVSGITKSGNTPISNVSIKLNGVNVATSDQNGEWSVNGLWGKNYFSFTHSLYKFATESVTEAKQIDSKGTFTLRGVVKDDLTNSALSYVMIKVGDYSTYTDDQGKFSVANVMLGDEIQFEKNGYSISSQTLNNTLQLNVLATPYFNASILVLDEDGAPLSGATVSIGNNNYTTNANGELELQNLVNEFNFTIYLDGYTQASAKITRNDNEKTLVLNRYFKLSLNAVSGDIVLNNTVSAKALIGGIEYNLDENGYFELPTDLSEPTFVTVSATDYNSMTLRADKNNYSLSFDLTYTISGAVNNGELSVSAEIIDTATNEVLTNTESDGTFELILKGSHTIIARADGLDFESVQTNKTATENFNATYSISGVLSSKNESIEGLKVSLFKGEDEQEFIVGADGAYYFNNLSGAYTLAVVSSSSLYPTSYKVTRGDNNYNFSANGYTVSGAVYSGGAGLEGVKVSAGDYSAYTRKDGSFVFDFIMGDQTLIASKDGYNFDATYDITVDNNGQNFTFNATYTISGKVLSNTTPIQDVIVTVGSGENVFTQRTDANGYFAFGGLSGSLPISFGKDGYSFAGLNTVTKPENLIISATFAVSGVVKTGDDVLEGVVVTNGVATATTDSNGAFTLNGISEGETISASATGYTFNSEIAEFGKSITLSGTFGIAGIVKVAGEAKDGVTVKLLNANSEVLTTITTANGGKFNFALLSGFGTLEFELAGYEFAPVTITGPASNMQVSAIFSINGYVRMAQTGTALSNVAVKLNNKPYYTNEQGYFEINGLSTNGVLLLEKQGYEFDTPMIQFSGATSVEVNATYWVTVVVKSGSIALDSVEVKCDDATTIQAEDRANTFTVRGLVGTHTITASALGYNDGSLVVSAPMTNGEIVLTYNVTINVSSASASAKLDNIKVDWTDESATRNYTRTYTEAVSAIVLENVVGVGSWTLSREDYRFTPEQGNFYSAKSNTFNAQFNKVYSLSGTVATPGGIGIAGMLVSATSETTNKVLATTYTSTNGAYDLTNLIGNVIINASLSVNITGGSDTAYTGVTSTQAANENTNTLNITISNQEYAYWLVQSGYQEIREAPSYYNETSGNVNSSAPLIGEVVQTTSSYRQKDSSGKFVSNNKNYGTKGQDTCVGLVGYLDTLTSSTNMQYKKVTSSKNANNQTTPITMNYGATGWTDSTVANYKSTFGSQPSDLHIYNLSKGYFADATISGTSGSAITVNFKASGDDRTLLGNYYTQMCALSGTTNITYKSVDATYTFEYNTKTIDGKTIGYYQLKQLYTVESYTVVAYGFTAPTTAYLTETFSIGGEHNYFIDKSLFDGWA